MTVRRCTTRPASTRTYLTERRTQRRATLTLPEPWNYSGKPSRLDIFRTPPTWRTSTQIPTWTRSAIARTFASCSGVGREGQAVGRRDGPVGRKNKEGRCVSPPSRTRTGPAAPERLVVRAQGVKEPMLPVFPCLRQRTKIMNKMNWKWTLVFAAALVGATVLLDAVAWAGKPGGDPPPLVNPTAIKYQIQFWCVPDGGAGANQRDKQLGRFSREFQCWGIGQRSTCNIITRCLFHAPSVATPDTITAIDLHAEMVEHQPELICWFRWRAVLDGWVIASATDINDHGVIVGYLFPGPCRPWIVRIGLRSRYPCICLPMCLPGRFVCCPPTPGSSRILGRSMRTAISPDCTENRTRLATLISFPPTAAKSLSSARTLKYGHSHEQSRSSRRPGGASRRHIERWQGISLDDEFCCPRNPLRPHRPWWQALTTPAPSADRPTPSCRKGSNDRYPMRYSTSLEILSGVQGWGRVHQLRRRSSTRVRRRT